ncbi:MAG TPA: hypothetical protein VGI52_01115 [Solirubrobacteraceae bacterium]|jgi:hypothetical protein
MNLERFRTVVSAVSDEQSAIKSLSLLVKLIKAVEELTKEVDSPALQKQVTDILRTLDDGLARAPSNDFPPAWREVLAELEIEDLVGNGLGRSIDMLAKPVKVDPDVVGRQLSTLADRLEVLVDSFDKMQESFTDLAIGEDKPAPGAFELGFMIPRGEVDEELGSLGREFVQLNRLLGPFLELSTGTRDPVRVRSISSSGFATLLEVAPSTAMMFAVALESLIANYETVLKIRLAERELAGSKLPDETLDAVSDHGRTLMSREIESLAGKLLASATHIEPERANELGKELKDSLTALANRIDRGFVIEVRTGELPPPTEGVSEQDVRAIAEEVLSKQNRLRPPVVSDQPVLGLPEPPDVEDPTTSKE